MITLTTFSAMLSFLQPVPAFLLRPLQYQVCLELLLLTQLPVFVGTSATTLGIAGGFRHSMRAPGGLPFPERQIPI